MDQSFTIKCNNCGTELKLIYPYGDNDIIHIWADDWREIHINCYKCGNYLN